MKFKLFGFFVTITKDLSKMYERRLAADGTETIIEPNSLAIKSIKERVKEKYPTIDSVDTISLVKYVIVLAKKDVENICKNPRMVLRTAKNIVDEMKEGK